MGDRTRMVWLAGSGRQSAVDPVRDVARRLRLWPRNAVRRANGALVGAKDLGRSRPGTRVMRRAPAGIRSAGSAINRWSSARRRHRNRQPERCPDDRSGRGRSVAVVGGHDGGRYPPALGDLVTVLSGPFADRLVLI